MSNYIRCQLGCWGMAAFAAALAALMLMVLGDWRLIQAAFGGVVIFILLGALLSWILCTPLPAQGEIPTDNRPPNPVPSTEEAAKDAVNAAREGTVSDDTAKSAAAIMAKAQMQPSAPLAGEQELAARKGEWTYSKPAQEDVQPEPVVEEAVAEAPEPVAAPEVAAEPVTVTETGAGEDYDKDGVIEGEDEGTRPEALDGPRGGTADNLKEIKGIGPKLEKLCNTLGFYHFDQIANWTADEVAWVNANLAGFKGRVTRDDWVNQATILAAGGETEFSKRVEDGDVY